MVTQFKEASVLVYILLELTVLVKILPLVFMIFPVTLSDPMVEVNKLENCENSVPDDTLDEFMVVNIDRPVTLILLEVI